MNRALSLALLVLGFTSLQVFAGPISAGGPAHYQPSAEANVRIEIALAGKQDCLNQSSSEARAALELAKEKVDFKCQQSGYQGISGMVQSEYSTKVEETVIGEGDASSPIIFCVGHVLEGCR
jgi:hypothetical protein